MVLEDYVEEMKKINPDTMEEEGIERFLSKKEWI